MRRRSARELDRAAALLDDVPASASELEARLGRGLPDLPGDGWSRWLLLALQRHTERQAWVGTVVRVPSLP